MLVTCRQLNRLLDLIALKDLQHSEAKLLHTAFFTLTMLSADGDNTFDVAKSFDKSLAMTTPLSLFKRCI
jgi:hypothetical protein